MMFMRQIGMLEKSGMILLGKRRRAEVPQVVKRVESYWGLQIKIEFVDLNNKRILTLWGFGAQ